MSDLDSCYLLNNQQRSLNLITVVFVSIWNLKSCCIILEMFNMFQPPISPQGPLRFISKKISQMSLEDLAPVDLSRHVATSLSLGCRSYVEVSTQGRYPGYHEPVGVANTRGKVGVFGDRVFFFLKGTTKDPILGWPAKRIRDVCTYCT